MQKEDYFARLPPELILKIMGILNNTDRLYFSASNKRIRNIYKSSRGDNFAFHIQGNSDKLFKAGFKNLLNTNFNHFKELRISNFKLQQSLDDKFPDLNNIFGKPHKYYLENSYAVRNVDTITITNCIITDYSILFLKNVFPNITNLSIIRCYTSMSKSDFLSVEKGEFLPLEELTITIPFYTDRSVETTFFGWLLDSFANPWTKLSFKKSLISKKRPVTRRYYRHKKFRLQNVFNNHYILDMAKMFEELRKRDFPRFSEEELNQVLDDDLRDVFNRPVAPLEPLAQIVDIADLNDNLGDSEDDYDYEGDYDYEDDVRGIRDFVDDWEQYDD